MQKLKTIILILIIGVIIIISTPAQAGYFYASDIHIYVDGNAINFSEGWPIIKDNRTYLPLREAAEGMKADVNWLPPNNVETKISGRTILMTIGSKDYTVNGNTKQMDIEPFLNNENNRTYVPIRFIADGLGYAVEWRQVNGVDLIFIFTKGQTETEVNALINGITQATAVATTCSSRTIGPDDPMFNIDYNLNAIGLKTPIINVDSKDFVKGYRWVCTSDEGMNTFHTFTYPDNKPVTVVLGKDLAFSFDIAGAGYDTTVTKGMKLTYDIYDAQNNLVRTVDFQL